MDNFWYYTLSAIPQTLAAIIALAATFVVFKLNLLSERIRDSRKDLRRSILLLTSYKSKEIHDIEPLSDDQFLVLYEDGLVNIKPQEEHLGLEPGIYKRLQKELERIIEQDWKSAFPARKERINGYLIMKKDLFKKLLHIKSTSIKLLGASLLFTSLTISFSLFALPNFNYFAHPRFITNLTLVLALFSVVITTFSVWKIAQSE